MSQLDLPFLSVPQIEQPVLDARGSRTAINSGRYGAERNVRPSGSPSVEPVTILRQPNPYANVPSLYDLYAQVSSRPAVLERFGMSIFRNGAGNIDKLPMDLPAGPEYVLGPGDGVSIDIWGGVAQRLTLSFRAAPVYPAWVAWAARL